MLSKKAIQNQIESYKEIMGDDYQDLTGILERTMTVGELKEILNDIDDSLPIRLDVMREEKDGSLSAEEGFLLTTREIVTEEGGDSETFVLVACSNFSPETLSGFPEDFE